MDPNVLTAIVKSYRKSLFTIILGVNYLVDFKGVGFRRRGAAVRNTNTVLIKSIQTSPSNRTVSFEKNQLHTHSVIIQLPLVVHLSDSPVHWLPGRLEEDPWTESSCLVFAGVTDSGIRWDIVVHGQ